MKYNRKLLKTAIQGQRIIWGGKESASMVILNQKKKTKKNPAFQIGETGKQSGKAWRRL